ncbi:hypothetical protein KUTeg_016526 [Tegillarca granosa]|uniref:F-box/LRR-repeat protein 15 n=1 Tax=Tegillarca granosa TaxID=220873 RepID=A0ABQ9EPZ0_TEGGR|nr:hypothetical protein KUTeg_016526 [Tegillarca granosa]
MEIDNCENMMFPEIRTSVEGNSLKITKLCLTSVTILEEHVSMLLNNCKQLEVLDLSHSIHLAQFPTDVSPLQPSGLDTLKTLILKRCFDMKILQIVNAPRLCSVDISNCVALSLVHLACTEVKEVAVNGCVSLKQFKLNPCVIENVNLKDLNVLEILEINSDVLSIVNLSCCTRMTTDMLLNAFTQRYCIKELNLTGCSNISPVDLNEKILYEFPNLEFLHYGGHVWSSAEIKSQNVKNLQFGDCNVLPCVPLNIPTLTHLHMFNCRDMTEQEMIDGFLYGKEIKKQRGLDKLIQENADYEPFKSGRGIPNLQVLTLNKMFGLHGDYISSSFSKFKHLTDVSIFSCPSLAHIFIDNCSNLRRFTIESCNRLSVCSFHRAPSLQILVIKWCSMVKDFTAVLPSLQKLDVTGTNFASFNLNSDFLEVLNLNGVCTQRDHKLFIRCPCLKELSLTKCDMLTDTVLEGILAQMNQLESITMSACPSISSLSVPGGVNTCSLTGHRRLKTLTLQQPINIQHLVLNNLAKFDPTLRLDFLKQCESSLKNLEVRAIPGEKEVILDLRNLESLTLDQGIHLGQLEIACQKLKYLRIQGCPRLTSLTMHIDKLSHLQIFHSSPLLALKCMSLYVNHVKHLARVLTYYCPNLETLHLHYSQISTGEYQSLGKAIPKLSCIILHDCIHDLSHQHVDISASDLERNTTIPLRVICST